MSNSTPGLGYLSSGSALDRRDRRSVNRRRFLRGLRNVLSLAVLGGPAWSARAQVSTSTPSSTAPDVTTSTSTVPDTSSTFMPSTTTTATVGDVAPAQRAASQPPSAALGLSVANYGAVGDGITDDTSAVQAALTDAAAMGVPLVFEKGVYRVEGLTASDVESVTILGRGEKSSVLKLRDDDGAGGIGQILRLTDVIDFTLRNIGLHGNFANAKPARQLEALVSYVTTAATDGRKDFSVVLESLEFRESAKGFGHLRIQIFENVSNVYSEFALIAVRNVRSWQHGNSGAALLIVGPGKIVDVENVSISNDGPFGLECYGVPTYPGARAIPIAISADKDGVHFIRQVRINNYTAFRANGALFTQKVKLLECTNMSVVEDCTNPSYDTSPVPVQAQTASDMLTASVPAGKYGNASIVRLATTGSLPNPLVAGQIYFVRDRAENQFRLALTSGGAKNRPHHRGYRFAHDPIFGLHVYDGYQGRRQYTYTR